MKKVLFVHNVNTSWVDRDREIVESKHKVLNFYVSSVWNYFSLKWFFNVCKSDVIYCWFASFSFFPVIILGRILGKRILIVSGGFDAAKANTIEYGAFTKSKFNQFFRRILFSYADKVLCVSKANLAETVINAKVSPERCELVYHGFSPYKKPLVSWSKRKNQVVLLCRSDSDTFYLKGIDQFLRLAELMPTFSFILIGNVSKKVEALLEKQLVPNFRWTNFLEFDGEEFNQVLNDSKVLVQLSQYESFGCSVIDGAIRGCFPITTSNLALFEVTKDVGSIVFSNNLDIFKNKILDVFNQEIDVNETVRRALLKYPLENRKKSILNLIEM